MFLDSYLCDFRDVLVQASASGEVLTLPPPVHSLIQQVFAELLFYARNYARCWGQIMNKTSNSVHCDRVYFLAGETVIINTVSNMVC